jgi:hypothetical protein
MKTKGLFVLFVGSLWPALLEGTPVDGPKIAGHLTAYTAAKICQNAPKPPCNPGTGSLVVHGEVNTPYNLYLLVLDGSATTGIAGASFGIEYDEAANGGLDVFSWVLCADAEYSGGPAGSPWPAAGSGNMIIWDAGDACQQTSASGDTDGGVTAVLGCFYVYAYSEDVFQIGRREFAAAPDFRVCTCEPGEKNLELPGAAGKVGFGSGQGVDPCQ